MPESDLTEKLLIIDFPDEMLKLRKCFNDLIENLFVVLSVK